MRKWSQGGVIASRFRGSAKKSNVCSSGVGTSWERSSRCSAIDAEPAAPGLAGRPALRCPQEVLERDVSPCSFRMGEQAAAVEQLGVDVDPAAVVADELGPNRQLAVDVHG